MLTFDARSIETYRSLKRLYLEQGKYDAAWCVCQALCVLQVANPEEQEFFQKRRARSLRGSTPLASQHWSLVTHPKKSGLLDQLFAYLYPILMPAMARNLKEFGLHKRKSVLDLKTERPVTIVLKHISSLTGLECPTVYHGMDKVSGMLNINTAPPSIVAGAQSLESSNLQQLCFDVARVVFLNAAPHFLALFPKMATTRRARLELKDPLFVDENDQPCFSVAT